mgnify:CR=1 FL=1
MKLFNRSRKTLGQTTVEYAIIIALIAVAAIGAYMALGTSTTNLLKAETDKLEGNDATRETVDTSSVGGPTLQIGN